MKTFDICTITNGKLETRTQADTTEQALEAIRKLKQGGREACAVYTAHSLVVYEEDLQEELAV